MLVKSIVSGFSEYFGEGQNNKGRKVRVALNSCEINFTFKLLRSSLSLDCYWPVSLAVHTQLFETNGKCLIILQYLN